MDLDAKEASVAQCVQKLKSMEESLATEKTCLEEAQTKLEGEQLAQNIYTNNEMEHRLNALDNMEKAVVAKQTDLDNATQHYVQAKGLLDSEKVSIMEREGLCGLNEERLKKQLDEIAILKTDLDINADKQQLKHGEHPPPWQVNVSS